MLSQRYALLHQRVLRHDLFRPTSIMLHQSNDNSSSTSSSHHGQLTITPIESLLGTSTHSNRTTTTTSNNTNTTIDLPRHQFVLLLGILLQIEENVYYLEDMTGQIPISFQEYQATTVEINFYITEHSILLFEGYYQDGIFYVIRLGQPLQETRSDAMRYISQQVSHPAYSFQSRHHHNNSEDRPTSSISKYRNDIVMDENSNVSFVLLQDLHMDQPRVVQQLEALLTSYEFSYSQNAADQLPVFIVMGNFMSHNHGNHNSNQSSSSSSSTQQQQPSALVQGLKSVLEDFVTTISHYPNLAKYGHFVIVPGPNDVTIMNHHILPIPSFPKSVTHGLDNNKVGVANLHFTSNPCRLRFQYGKEMVVFRYDLLHLFQQHQIRLPTLQQDMMDDEIFATADDGTTTTNMEPHHRLYKTILDQGHLIPISSIPMYWNYRHCLSLYPLPSCLVLAGNTGTVQSKEYYDNYCDCDVIQTISFGQNTNTNNTIINNGAHVIYRPTTTSTHNNIGPLNRRSNDRMSDATPDTQDDDTERLVEFGRVA
jgi:DNA polymerase epsilon subunit 2